MTIKTRVATNIALLTAISIILTRVFGILLPIGGAISLRLSFGTIPVMLAGVLFGPMAGGITGLAADLIGTIINPQGGPFFPGFTLSSVLTGVIPGVWLYRRKTTPSILQLGLMILVTDLVTGVFLNTFWLTIMLGKGFFVLLPPRLLARLVTLPVYTIVIDITRRAYLVYQGSATKINE